MRKLSAKSIRKFITNRTGKYFQKRTRDHYRNRIQKDYQNRTCKRVSLPRCGFSVKVEQIAIFRLITGFN